MATEILVRERKSVKHGKTYEYRFEAAIGGKRKWISKGGFLSSKEAKAAGIVSLNEYINCGGVVFDSAMSYMLHAMNDIQLSNMVFEEQLKVRQENEIQQFHAAKAFNGYINELVGLYYKMAELRFEEK